VRAVTAAETQSTLATRKLIDEWFYIPSWQRSVPPASVASSESYGPWLIFTDGGPLADQITATLEKRGEKVLTANAGAGFGSDTKGGYTIRADRPEDYLWLLNDIHSHGSKVRSVLHLWGLADAGKSAFNNGKKNFDSLVYLAQAFGEKDDRSP